MIRSPSSKPTKVELTNKELDYGRVAISFQDEGLQERTVKTKLLVAADGANSFVRKMLGMPTLSMGYGRKAVTTTVRIKPNQSMNKTAYQRFFPNGPLALLPMWDGTYANIVWSTTPDKVDRLLSLSREEFVHELNESLQAGPTTPPLLLKNKGEYLASYPFALNVVYGVDMLARAAGEGLAMSRWNDDPFQIPPQVGEVLGKRFAFDLSLCQARQYVQPRVALVGDAAHTVHPMAGQGLNLGIADAQCLAEYILSAKQAGMDPGESYFLAQYQRERQAAVATMQGGIHAIHAAFGAEATPLLWLRSIGVNMINMTTPLRRKLAEVAAGNIV